MGTTRALSCLQIPSFPRWSRDNAPCFQAPPWAGISEGFATGLETSLAVLWNKEEFFECAQGWSRARRRLSLVMALLGMLGVHWDTPVLLQALLPEGWELGIWDLLFQRCRSVPDAAKDEIFQWPEDSWPQERLHPGICRLGRGAEVCREVPSQLECANSCRVNLPGR